MYSIKNILDLRQLIYILLILTSINLYCQTEENKIKLIQGIYKGNNLFIRNPFGSNGVGFCIKGITINGKKVEQFTGSVVELDFSSIGVNINDSLNILIEHDPYCGPGFLNLDEIQSKVSNFNNKSVLIHGTILDEITKRPIFNANVLTINKKDSGVVSFVSPGIGLGTYNIIANWGDAYEVTFQSDDEKFNYSIKKIVLDLRGIPTDGSFNFKTKIDVEFLLSKKGSRLLDSLFSRFPVAKLSYNSYSKKLEWDKEYSEAIKETGTSLLKQIEKENEVKEKSSIIQQEQQLKKYLLSVIFFIALITIFSIYAFFKQKKLKELFNQKKNEAEEQKHLVEEKQKEILDSINYAKRIQKAHLPTEKYIAKNIDRLKN